jgi:hypothetical protein
VRLRRVVLGRIFRPVLARQFSMAPIVASVQPSRGIRLCQRTLAAEACRCSCDKHARIHRHRDQDASGEHAGVRSVIAASSADPVVERMDGIPELGRNASIDRWRSVAVALASRKPPASPARHSKLGIKLPALEPQLALGALGGVLVFCSLLGSQRSGRLWRVRDS